MNTTNDESSQYKVGNKKPPRHSQFQPGQSGNPHNGSSKTTVTGWLKHWMSQDEITASIQTKKDGKTKSVEFSIKNGQGPLMALVALQLIKGAVEGDLAFIREFMDRTEGKAKQEVAVTQKGRRRVTRDEEGNVLVVWEGKEGDS